MGQSKFKWIIVFENGDSDVFEGTLDELTSKIAGWFSGEPIAIIRGKML